MPRKPNEEVAVLALPLLLLLPVLTGRVTEGPVAGALHIMDTTLFNQVLLRRESELMKAPGAHTTDSMAVADVRSKVGDCTEGAMNTHVLFAG